MSRHRQLRSGRVLRFGLSSLGPLVGSVAEKFKDSMLVERFTHRGGPHSVDLWCVWRTLNDMSNVDARPSLANGSRLGMRAACTVGLETNGCRERTW